MMKNMFLFTLFCLITFSESAELYNRTPYDFAPASGDSLQAVLQLSCDIASKPGTDGQTVEYQIHVENGSGKVQTVNLGFKPDEWAVMPIDVVPDRLKLAPNQSAVCTVRMTVNDKLPKGSHEERTLVATPDSPCESAEIKLATVRFLDHPYMFVNENLIKQAKSKIEKYDWARKNFDQLKNRAAMWLPPEPKVRSLTREGITWNGLFPNYCTPQAWEAAVVWLLTGDQDLKDKLLRFLKTVADPETGYITTRWAVYDNAYVHEGEFFTFYAALYDVLYNDSSLTLLDHENIEKTIRLYLKTCKVWHRECDIGNWIVGADAGAICGSAVLQDIANIDYFLNCPKGMKEQLSLGIMGDGWWLEGASNYNYVVARFFFYAAMGVESFGINLFDLYIPTRHLGNTGRQWQNGWMGMNFDIWGPSGRAYRCMKDLYDGVPTLMDEEGGVAANNDSARLESGDVFELGYYHYKDPAYLWCIGKSNRMSWQSLIYGAGHLTPAPDPRSMSGHLDNIGIAALRSQKENQKPDEQIQTFLKWGTHGGWHGHFDRCSLVGLRRFGTTLLMPRASWFGYPSPMYKAWVQPSISHSMVIVDQYQQEPVESKLLMFYGGKSIQACAVETRARWTQKMPFDAAKNPSDLDSKNRDKMIDYGDAEPVLQRRLLVVLDDYILVFDYLKGQQEHMYDWLVHPVGFIRTIADDIQGQRFTERMSDDPESSYYYITDCEWSKVSGTVVNQFKDGKVHFDISTILNAPMEMATGTFPSAKPVADALKRETLLFRAKGTEFKFTSLMEPYLTDSVVKKISCDGWKIIVELKDGRRQITEVSNFENTDGDVHVNFKEYRDEELLRKETSEASSL